MCIPLPRKRESQWNYMKQGVLGEHLNSNPTRRPIMRYYALVIVMGLGLAMATPNDANAQYIYKYYDYDLVTVKSSYSTYTSYDMFVDSWGSTSTRSEYFIDSGRRRWSLVESTFDIVPGYSYTSYNTTSLQYYRLCGSTYYSSSTGCYYYKCACGRTFYYRP